MFHGYTRYVPAMSLLASFLVLLLILVETAPPTAASIPLLGKVQIQFRNVDL